MPIGQHKFGHPASDQLLALEAGQKLLRRQATQPNLDEYTQLTPRDRPEKNHRVNG